MAVRITGLFKTANTNGTNNSGQALVELALTMPLLILLLLGAVELGRVAFASIEVSNAARTAVQYGAMNGGAPGDAAGMLGAANSDAYDLISSVEWVNGYPQHSCTCSDGTATPSDCSTASVDCASSYVFDTVTVKVQATYNPLIHWPGSPGSYTLYGQAVQKVLP